MDKPLVSMCMPVYNRPDYVREALQSALDQTYDPLEIVISDNCSTDDTPKIVQEMIAAYKAKGGTHTFVFNRNSENIGGGKNIAKTFELAHGELLVPAHDDDVSLPTRVEKIVAAWEASGRKATVIGHDVYHGDAKGNLFELYTGFDEKRPCTAIQSYSRVLVDFPFPEFDPNNCLEESVYHCRALMLGPYVKIHEPLMMYRKEVGVSSSSKRWRATMGQLGRGAVKACGQVRNDLAAVASNISKEAHERIVAYIESIERDLKYPIKLYSGESFAERWDGFVHYRVPFRPWRVSLFSFFCVQVLSVFPCAASDALIDAIMGKKQRMRKQRMLAALKASGAPVHIDAARLRK